MLVSPVTFPPGRRKLAARPLPTGSPTLTIRIGVSRVAVRAASAEGVPVGINRRQCAGKGIADRGATPIGGTPEQFAEHLRKETEKWAKVIKAAGIKPQ